MSAGPAGAPGADLRTAPGPDPRAAVERHWRLYLLVNGLSADRWEREHLEPGAAPAGHGLAAPAVDAEVCPLNHTTALQGDSPTVGGGLDVSPDAASLHPQEL